MLSMGAGGGWGLHLGEAQHCVPCPARMAWHLSWSETEHVMGLPGSLVLLWVLVRRKKSPPAPQRDQAPVLPSCAGWCPELRGLDSSVLKGASSFLSDLHLHGRGG